jgi:uncharacterized membrane protein (Fun14 family)
MSPDTSGESVYTRKGIIPIHRDESLTLRYNKKSLQLRRFFLLITYFLKAHFIISFQLGFLPYIKMPVR